MNGFRFKLYKGPTTNPFKILEQHTENQVTDKADTGGQPKAWTVLREDAIRKVSDDIRSESRCDQLGLEKSMTPGGKK